MRHVLRLKTIPVAFVLAFFLALPVLGQSPLSSGRFGRALDATQAQPAAAAREEYVRPPLSVECWVLLRSSVEYNLVLANESKTSETHWEIYTAAGTGQFGVLLRSHLPENIMSTRSITDGQWHYLAVLFEPDRVRLYVDGDEVANQKIRPKTQSTRKPGALTFGTTAGQYNSRCDGLIDEVRISHGVRTIQGVPAEPLAADEQTVGLWRMDQVRRKGELADLSRLNNPAVIPEVRPISMNELDRRSFKPGPSPLESKARSVSLQKGTISHPSSAPFLSLDGNWELAEGGNVEDRLGKTWPDAISAKVPGSVHAALVEAGRIPDPTLGRNDAIAHDQSFKTWWFKRTFKRLPGATQERLVFDGVAIRCTVWLNGQLLGSNDGMFGGPEFPVASLLRDENTLIVKLDPAPGDPKRWSNPDWRTTVVFNNVWGWHYASIPALGIWRPVRIEGEPAVRILHPFVATRDAAKGEVDLVVDLHGRTKNWAGRLSGTIEPDNFAGEAHRFIETVKSTQETKRARFRLRVPSPRLWWPNDLGEQNLYRLKISFEPESGGVADVSETTFGLRTIEMRPLPGGPRSDQYNWTFVINGKPVFVKGTGWCTMDPLMDFSRGRYEHFLTLAKQQHVQMLRAWGSGMPETDDFYDLCDRKGIMVMQEWPTAWNSHLVQPYDVMERTVRLNTLRIRNHPSLVMYGGGNEIPEPFGEAIDMMGRLSVELDGTRPFHRTSPWGGSHHSYRVYWGQLPLDYNLNMTSAFWGEFGLASLPVHESVLRYLPDDEKNVWPAPRDGSLVHHTPTFTYDANWVRLSQYSGYFVEPTDLKAFITGSQLAQAVGVRHTLERARTRWPQSTGALYYKMNDNYPAASWASVDWYGAPKISHYFFQDAFAPLHACVIFDSLNNNGKAVSWPVFLLDDNDALKQASWAVVVRAFDAQLQLVKTETYRGTGAISGPRSLGSFTLAAEETNTAPLFVVVDVKKNGTRVGRTFYFVNFEAKKGSLFTLPRTVLSLQAKDGQAIVSNRGSVPAVGVAVLRPGNLATFNADDNYFWLDAGESHTVGVSTTEGLRMEAWNVD